MSSPRITVSETAEHEAMVMVDNCPIPFGFRRLEHPELSAEAMAWHYLRWLERNGKRVRDLNELEHLCLFTEHDMRLQQVAAEFATLQQSGVWIHADRVLEAATNPEEVFAAFLSAIGTIQAAFGPAGVAMLEEVLSAQEGCDPWAALAAAQAACAEQAEDLPRRARMRA